MNSKQETANGQASIALALNNQATNVCLAMNDQAEVSQNINNYTSPNTELKYSQHYHTLDIGS